MWGQKREEIETSTNLEKFTPYKILFNKFYIQIRMHLGHYSLLVLKYWNAVK